MWNTFLGSEYPDEAYAIDADQNGNVYVAGRSSSPWGDTDAWRTDFAFASGLDLNGNLIWTSFLGGLYYNEAYGISVDRSNHIVISGESVYEWGSPLRPFSGDYSAFVAQLTPNYSTIWLPLIALH